MTRVGGDARNVLGAGYRIVQRGIHLFREVAGDKLHRSDERTEIARRGAADHFGQQRRELRHVSERLQRGDDVVERQMQRLQLACPWIGNVDVAPRGSESVADRRETRGKIRMLLPARSRARAVFENGIERGIARGPHIEAYYHRWRCSSVENT